VPLRAAWCLGFHAIVRVESVLLGTPLERCGGAWNQAAAGYDIRFGIFTMRMHTATTLAVAFFAAPVAAQSAPEQACPAGNGIRIYTVAGGADSAAPKQILATATDTVLTFDFAERKWSRTDFAAMVDVGWASDDRRRFSVCAGVSVEMPDATLVVRGARGTVHFRASLDRLTLARASSRTM